MNELSAFTPKRADLPPKISRWIHYLGLFLLFQFLGCAAQNAYNRAQDAARHEEWDRAVSQYLIALNKHPDNASYRTGFERARLAASQFHFQKAKLLVQTMNYEQAIIEYQLALNFDPTNQFIANELENARTEYQKQLNKEQLTEIEKAKEAAKKNMQIYKVLGPEAEKMIPSMKFHDDSLKHILDALGQLAGINIVYDSDFRDQEFSISLDNIKFKDSLEQILVANRLYYKPLDQSTILVIPDNPQKRRQYDEQVIQTFYLSNAELNDVLNMVRSVMQIQRIATNPQLNAITVRDTPDKIAIVQKIIEANDKSRSEVLLDIEILEIDRDQAMKYGVDLSNYAVTQSLVVNQGTTGTGTGGGTATGTAGQLFGNQFKGIDAASWQFTVPSIIYNALASDQRTKLLAKPQIRASEGQQVTVRLGDRVPIPVNVFQTAGTIGTGGNVTTFPTTSFQQQDVGINIDITPRVHHNREISLTMRFELTSITAPGTGTIPPTIGNRTVNTIIRLKDGETNLLAGLLRKDERKALRGLPGIIHLPFVREIFASNDNEVQEKDIVFTITPHILRTPNVTEADLSPIWIGTEDDIQLKQAPPISVFENPQANQAKKPWELSPLPGENPPGEEETIEPEKPGVVTPVQPQTQPNGAPKPTKPSPPPENKSEQPPVSPEELAAMSSQESPQGTVTPNQEAPPPAEKPVPAAVPKVVPQTQSASQQPNTGGTISFASPNVNPKTDTDLIVHVQLNNAPDAAGVSLFLSFDPSAIKVNDVLQGAFVTPGAFSKSFDNGRGSININATRTPGAEAVSGIVATIVLHSLKPGKTTINLNSAVLHDSKNQVIPVTFLPYTIVVE
ncbi:MAG: hypothetical protein C5B54_08470 [Acidobacteria bacterium]|nr:MAG: hypothetical protein C5B54_08470 [Acidobacteriota bacterium]